MGVHAGKNINKYKIKRDYRPINLCYSSCLPTPRVANDRPNPSLTYCSMGGQVKYQKENMNKLSIHYCKCSLT